MMYQFIQAVRLLALLVLCLFVVISPTSRAHEVESTEVKLLKKLNTKLKHDVDSIRKEIDDLRWYHRLENVAFVDKVYMTGPPRAHEKNKTALGYGNPLKFWAYVYIPKDINYKKKYPLLVFPHGGVHSNHTTYYTHIIKELMAQGYIVVCPEYRGSTGYGRRHYEDIDYGGLETEDTKASRDYMLEHYEFIDKNRVGILGWSHGGMITLHNLYNYPKAYKVGFAGVPVSDLIARMGYHDDGYRNLYSADYHLGKTAKEDLQEYRKRSPAWNAEKLQTPLLIHTNTIDDDVAVIEVEHLIKSLKAAGKKFDYEIFQAVPGGHSFDRMDTMDAKKIRLKIYKHLAKYLKPQKLLKTVDDINQAAYRR